MNNTKLTSLGVLVAWLFASAAGVAADNCSGHYVSVGVSGDSSEVSSGNSLGMFRAVTVNITDDKNSSLNMSVGDCVGTMITAASKTDASGRCTRKDKDGDLYSYEWVMPA